MKHALVLGAFLVVTVGFIVGASLYWPKRDERASAIERCRAAIDAFPRDAGDYDILRVVLRECAGMVGDEQCKDSMERAAASSGVESVGIALAGCRAKYCTGLPNIELCARQEYANREEESLAGAQLMAAIFTREGGTQARALFLAVMRSKDRMQPVPLPVVTAEPPSHSDVRVEISNDDRVTLVAVEGGVIAALPVSQLAAFLTGKQDLLGARFYLIANSNIEHLRVIVVLDALKQAGVNKIAFGVFP